MKHFLTSLLLVTGTALSAQVSHELIAADFEFIPDTLVVEQFDSVHIVFSSPTHTFSQVDQATWEMNGDVIFGQYNVGPGVEDTTLVLDATGTIYYICLNHIDMGMKGLIDVQLAAGIQDRTALGEITFRPNPTKDWIRPERPFAGTVNIIFTDVAGRVAFTTTTTGSDPIDVSALPDGNYTLRITATNGELLNTGTIVVGR